MSNQPVVLYVEDDPRSRQVMSLLLEKRMKLPNVNLFEDSEDFLSRLSALDPRPTVIFLDIHIKPLSGFEMLEIIRKSPEFADIPVIALTASVMNEEVHRLRTAGFTGCLAKPIDLETFPDLLNQILNGESIWRIV